MSDRSPDSRNTERLAYVGFGLGMWFALCGVQTGRTQVQTPEAKKAMIQDVFSAQSAVSGLLPDERSYYFDLKQHGGYVSSDSAESATKNGVDDEKKQAITNMYHQLDAVTTSQQEINDEEHQIQATAIILKVGGGMIAVAGVGFLAHNAVRRRIFLHQGQQLIRELIEPASVDDDVA